MISVCDAIMFLLFYRLARLASLERVFFYVLNCWSRKKCFCVLNFGWRSYFLCTKFWIAQHVFGPPAQQTTGPPLQSKAQESINFLDQQTSRPPLSQLPDCAPKRSSRVLNIFGLRDHEPLLDSGPTFREQANLGVFPILF